MNESPSLMDITQVPPIVRTIMLRLEITSLVLSIISIPLSIYVIVV